jgi:hypothetical protein
MRAPLGFLLCFALSAQTPEVGQRKKLIYHDIRTDAQGNILPWFSDDPGTAYDHGLNLVWTYWKYMPNYWTNSPPEYRKLYGATAGVKKYMVQRTLDDMGIGGDQVAMVLSSWALYYAYTGNPEIVENMKYQADLYIANSLSKPTDAWPNLPYPCNTTKLAVYDGDLVAGPGYTQPDKAGSIGAELVTLFKITGDRKYLDVALKIADTLAQRVKPGDDDNSPLPFRVYAPDGRIKDPYTSNWTGALRLWESLMAIKEGDAALYRKAHGMMIDWLKAYPIKTNKWGPFFEDIPRWSDTEINAGTLAWYMMEHADLFPNWRTEVRGIQDWVLRTLGIDYWKRYGLTVIGEQTVYRMQGNSHTSRHASVEIIYAEKSGDTTKKAEAIRQLNWATYMVDDDGKNWYPNFEVYEIWWTDGYGDYVRHYLRAMAAEPELAPAGQNHLLRSSSVIRTIRYEPKSIAWQTFDPASTELLRVTAKPRSVSAGGKTIDTWTWKALAKGGVLRVSHDASGDLRVEF